MWASSINFMFLLDTSVFSFFSLVYVKFEYVKEQIWKIFWMFLFHSNRPRKQDYPNSKAIIVKMKKKNVMPYIETNSWKLELLRVMGKQSNIAFKYLV